MEINYDLIIKYLVKKTPINDNIPDHPPYRVPTHIHPKQKSMIGLDQTENNKANSFLTQKNIFNYSSNFPDKFKNMLTDKYYRYGITAYDNENHNISFWSSILTLIDKNFIIPYTTSESELINQFKIQLIDKYAKSKLSSFLKSLDKNDVRERFKLEPDIYVLQYIVDVLDINMLIMDFESDNIWSVFRKDIMNPLKQTLLFSKYSSFWEPIMLIKSKGNTQRLFDINDNIIKKIFYNESIKYFPHDQIQKDFIVFNNIDDIIQLEKTKLKISEVTKKLDDPVENNDSDSESESSESSVKTDSDQDIFIENDEYEEIKQLNKTKMNKMKIADLLELSNKLKLPITKKNPTKAILMESILSKINQLTK
jgi:hypothetical protein